MNSFAYAMKSFFTVVLGVVIGSILAVVICAFVSPVLVSFEKDAYNAVAGVFGLEPAVISEIDGKMRTVSSEEQKIKERELLEYAEENDITIEDLESINDTETVEQDELG